MSEKKGRPVLLAVILLIAIVLAIGITAFYPYLVGHSRNFHREARGMLSTIAMAEEDFRANDRDKNGIQDYWVKDLSALDLEKRIQGSDADNRKEGDSPRSYSYWVGAMKMRGDGVRYADARKDSFAFCAFPDRYEKDGKLTFIMCEDRTIWSKDLGGKRVEQWPRDPEADGWKRVD